MFPEETFCSNYDYLIQERKEELVRERSFIPLKATCLLSSLRLNFRRGLSSLQFWSFKSLKSYGDRFRLLK